jgi:hypothetical protein
MEPVDIAGSLYDEKGLSFGGFRTSVFFEVTEGISIKKLGIRERIIAEAHYLVYWLNNFPEIIFLIGIIFFKSLWVGLFLFTMGFIFEKIRFYFFGASPLVSWFSMVWEWIKTPVLIVTAVLLWVGGYHFLSVVLMGFLVVQGWLSLISLIGMLPLDILITGIARRKRGRQWGNTQSLALNFVINYWRYKLTDFKISDFL